VVRIVRFHSSQDRTNRSTAMSVFQSINQHLEEVQVAADLAEEVEAMVEEAALEEEAALTEDHEKCTRQLVEIVVRIVKFHSSQDRTNRSTAMNVFQIIKGPKNTLV